MDEPTDPAAERQTADTMPLIAGQLSPVQQAYSRYATHALACPVCRDVDRGSCGTADTLWRAYQEAGQQAYQRLTQDSRPRPTG